MFAASGMQQMSGKQHSGRPHAKQDDKHYDIDGRQAHKKARFPINLRSNVDDRMASSNSLVAPGEPILGTTCGSLADTIGACNAEIHALPCE